MLTTKQELSTSTEANTKSPEHLSLIWACCTKKGEQK